MKFLVVLSAVLALSAAVPVEMTLQQIDQALSDPNTNPALIPILESALNHIMQALMNGQQLESTIVNIPSSPSLNPEPAPIPIPSPVPAEPAPAPEPVPVPAEPEMPEVSPAQVPEKPFISSPLVQVVVNVDKN